MNQTPPTVVACLGDSITNGLFSFDWVGLLAKRLGPNGFTFRNFGRNGDLAYNALKRLDPVVAAAPQFVVILLGTNDVNATMSDASRRRYVRGQRLPCDPTLDWFRENLTGIIAELGERTTTKVVLLSLPVLGEDLNHTANQKTAEYSEVIRNVATASGSAYLPLHERQRALLAERSGPAYRDGLGAIVGAAAQRYLLRRSWDAISQRAGLMLTTDGIHLNSIGGGMVADLVERFLHENSVANHPVA